jgi:hypothetical protein
MDVARFELHTGFLDHSLGIQPGESASNVLCTEITWLRDTPYEPQRVFHGQFWTKRWGTESLTSTPHATSTQTSPGSIGTFRA